MSERMQKLKELHKKRQEARMLNQAQVVEEDRRNKEPKNMEARRRRAQYILEEEKQRTECEAQGKDFDREKLKQVSAEDAEIGERRKRAKMNPDKGFSTYEAAAFRKYNQQVKSIRPDMEKYEESKESSGEAFYATAGTVVHGVHEDSKDAIDKMAQDVEAQIAKREKYSRRRMHDDDADIDYINERNKKFNKKLERFYNEYTKDIKDNLERGTAV
eukprot:07467.XXX_391389_390679_1 [CDS] Oithona nana genome sequencing.